MKNAIKFTDRERFILSYYRDPQLSSLSRHAAFDSIYLGASLLFVLLYFLKEDIAWGLIGYGILCWRVGWGHWRSRQFTADLRSILQKYDAALGE